MRRKLIFIVFGTLLLMFNASCVHSIVRYDGPYEGKVVDADTGLPIEGVVVLGVWYKEEPTVAGTVSSYYDARETATDKNGDFKIPGMGLKVMSNVGSMHYLVFKSGYEYIGLWPWESLKEDEILKAKIRWEGKKAVIPLKKLTMVERKKNMPPLPPGEAPYEKIKLMLNEYNKDSKELGVGIIDTWRDKR